MKAIQKIHIYQTQAYSINFKTILMESALHCSSDEKTALNSVHMLRQDCLLKMPSQKNIALPKPCALEEETDITFYSTFEGNF